MSPSDLKEFIRSYLALFARDPDHALNQYVADPALIRHIEQMRAAFPGYTIAVEDLIAEDDRIALRGIVRGVHRGEFAGRHPTGREIAFPVIIIYRVAKGKIVESWIQADMLTLLKQIDEAPRTARPATR